MRHPDLVQLGRSLRDRMDRTLDAELEAARTAARRRRSMRDRLLDAEDVAAVVAVGTSDGSVLRGTVDCVGVDHVDLIAPGCRWTVAVAHIATIETAV